MARRVPRDLKRGPPDVIFVLAGSVGNHGDARMPMDKQIYCRRDDEPHLRDDDLAGKVSRYIQYVALVDTSRLQVMALGRTIILSGFVSNEAEIGCIEQAAASVIGVHLVENTVTVRHH